MPVIRAPVHALGTPHERYSARIVSRPVLVRPRILLADDHRIVSEGIGRLLERHLEIVATVEDGDTLLDLAHRSAQVRDHADPVRAVAVRALKRAKDLGLLFD